jgi:hypothetical protein
MWQEKSTLQEIAILLFWTIQIYSLAGIVFLIIKKNKKTVNEY